MKHPVKIKFKYGNRVLLLVIDFLITVNKRENDRNVFTLKELIFYTSLNSGGEYLRECRTKGLIKYNVPLRKKGKYILKSDIFDLERAKNIINDGKYYVEVKEPLFEEVEQLELIAI
jgi:hypothetical protein